VETYIEVPFKSGDKQLFPDGLIRVTRGQRRWTALVEVKTGSKRTAGGAVGAVPGRRARRRV
jgi:Holliday junction resolvase-like predicted endonuclease